MIHNCSSLCNPWTAICQASLSIMISLSLFKLMFIESVMPSNHLVICHSLLPLLSVFPSIRVFPNESVAKVLSFSFSISPYNESSGLIPFKFTGLKSLPFQWLSRVFSSTIIWKHQFFSTQPSLWSNSHICTWLLKKLSLAIWTFVSKGLCF